MLAIGLIMCCEESLPQVHLVEGEDRDSGRHSEMRLRVEQWEVHSDAIIHKMYSDQIRVISISIASDNISFRWEHSISSF